MTIEIFYRIALVQIILSIFFVAISLLFYKRTSPITRVLAVAFASGAIAFFSVGLLDLKGKQVNIPQNIDSIPLFLFRFGCLLSGTWETIWEDLPDDQYCFSNLRRQQ